MLPGGIKTTAKDPLKLIIEAKLQNLSVISDFIAGSLEQFGVKEGVFHIQMAVDEACTNVIKYAYEDAGGNITITCDVKDNILIIVINDRGKPFDPHTVRPPDLESSLDQRRIGGLGIYLMKKFMDDVSYSFDQKKGNTLVMKKSLAAK